MAIRNKPATDLSQGSIAMPFASSLVAFARSRSVDRAELLCASGLTEAQLEDADARLPLRDFAKLVRQAKRLADEPGLPLHFAAQADFSEVSIVGLIANASPTMRDALESLNRYSGLTISVPMDGDVPLRMEGGAHYDRIVNCRRPGFFFPELTEIVFTYLITGPRRFLPSPHILSAMLDYPAPEYAHVYSDIWQCEVIFDAAESALTVPKWVSDHPVRLQPPYALSILIEHADQLMARLDDKAEFSKRLEAMFMRALHTGDVTAHWAARELGMSRQSLYRQLKAEETSFEQLLDRVRLSVSIDHLENGTASVSEIAHLTGYSDASAFSRAFKRWTGKMPGAWRKAARER